MSYLQGQFSVNGLPRNGATANLYAAAGFSVPPVAGDPLPATGILDTQLTSSNRGGDGAYRFTVAATGEWWVGIDWNGQTAWEYHLLQGSVQQTNVKDYGALGDGTTDDTAAIQSAISSTSFGEVLFPAGVYIVKPTTGTWLTLKSNLTLRGTGKGSVIKVSSSAGNYETIFSAATAATFIQNLTVRDLVIDQNTSGNTSATVSTTTGHLQYVFKFFSFDGITIERVHFDPCDGVNTVLLNGATAKNARVNHCHFNWAPVGGAASYDNSAVYFNCENHEAIGNSFFAAPSGNARGCIETHNGPSTIHGNRSIGYRTGVNIVSRSSSGSLADRIENDIAVVGNAFTACCQGITLWPLTGQRLSNISIAGNVIDLSQVDHNQGVSWGIAWADDVNGTVSGSTDSVVIDGNVISFQTEVNAGRAALDSFANYGIGVAGAGPVNNLQIRGNVVRNVNLRGLILSRNARVGNTLSDAVIEGNLLVDCGSSSGLVNDGNRMYLGFFGPCVNVRVTRNSLVDSGVSALNGYQSFYANSAFMSGSGNALYDNPVYTHSGLALLNSVNANTSGMVSTAISFADSVSVSGHVVIQTTTPTLVSGTGAGTGPTMSVSGTDQAGVISLTTGTSPSGSAIVMTLSFSKAFSAKPRSVILSPANQAAHLLTGAAAPLVYQTNVSTTGFEISSDTALAGTTTYQFYYWVGG